MTKKHELMRLTIIMYILTTAFFNLVSCLRACVLEETHVAPTAVFMFKAARGMCIINIRSM